MQQSSVIAAAATAAAATPRFVAQGPQGTIEYGFLLVIITISSSGSLSVTHRISSMVSFQNCKECLCNGCID